MSSDGLRSRRSPNDLVPLLRSKSSALVDLFRISALT